MKIDIPSHKSGDAPLRREVHPEVRIIDANQGIVDYVASDETLDAYREIIRVGGWKFNLFRKNAPFVDSHNYSSIGCLLGNVVDYKIQNSQLVERVQWAKNIPDTLAWWGWKMVEGGFLKAVSVGFYPTKWSTRWDADPSVFAQQCAELKLSTETAAMVQCVYLEQEQIELSACVIGANPNALAKAYKAGALTEEDLEKLSRKIVEVKTVRSAEDPADAERAKRRAQLALMLEIQRCV